MVVRTHVGTVRNSEKTQLSHERKTFRLFLYTHDSLHELLEEVLRLVLRHAHLGLCKRWEGGKLSEEKRRKGTPAAMRRRRREF